MSFSEIPTTRRDGIKVPKVPNFVRYVSDPDRTISIAELDDDDLRLLGEAWTAQLLERAREMRESQDAPPA